MVIALVLLLQEWSAPAKQEGSTERAGPAGPSEREGAVQRCVVL